MRIHCPDCEFDICDFCMHYCFNGEWKYSSSDGWVYYYNDEGFCRLDMTYKNPDDICDNFHCFLARKAIKI